MTIVESFIFLGFVNATNSGVAEAGGQVAYAHPDFGRIEGAARHRRRATILLAHSYLINNPRMFNLGINDLAKKPYIPQKNVRL